MIPQYSWLGLLNRKLCESSEQRDRDKDRVRGRDRDEDDIEMEIGVDIEEGEGERGGGLRVNFSVGMTPLARAGIRALLNARVQK